MPTFSKGKKVRILDPLPLSADDFLSHVVHQRKGIVHKMKNEDEVHGKYAIWLEPVENTSNLSQFWVYTDWIEDLDAPVEVKGCVCPITTLMASGCKCGEIQRERGQSV